LVGDHYLWGEEGANRDGAVALKWHQLAAEAGNERAIKTLGDYYWSGYQVQLDRAVGRILFQFSASLGWREAEQALREGDDYTPSSVFTE
jgi:TPR repeat protein